MRRGRSRGQGGFSLIELMLVMAGIVLLSTFAVPSFNSAMETIRARDAARSVERQLQTARMKAVTHSRAMRVRFNCPVVGQFRMIEVTGVAGTDTASNRCSQSAFPFPGPNDTLRSTPSLDSAVMYLPPGTTVTGAVTNIEFGSRGSAFAVDGSGAVTNIVGNLVLTVTYKGRSNTVTVNALGRVRFN